MNGSRSTFMRKGYLLTALAAAVLLAASPGIASAQSIGFTSSGGSVMEGADNNVTTTGPDALQVSITVRDLPADDPATADDNERTDALGAVAITGGGELSITDADGAAVTVTDISDRFATNDTVRLYVHQTAADGDWMDEEYSLKLTAAGATDAPVSVTADVFVVTVEDTDIAPVAKFMHVNAPNISLQEASTTTIGAQIDPGTTTAADQGVMSANPALMVMITPATAMIGDCATDGNFLDIESPDGTNVTLDEGVFSLAGSTRAASTQGTANASATFTALTVEACADMDTFRDMQLGLSFVATSLASATDGSITDGGGITITVDSNEAAPTVSFATSSIDIDEGATNTVAILADGALGAEVGTVMVSVSGDAMLSLWQGSDMLEANADGMYQVMLGTDDMPSANTILTISADSDRDLEDGMTSTATLTIESASGANIGDRDSLMVTVMGSTAVPALPLVGQLLLALFLMAGGARLYRRRQQG